MAFVSAIGAVVRRKGALARLLAAPVLLSLGFAPSSTESAVANGDTRTIILSNSHTDESGTFTYMVDGVYDSATLEKLNWFMRDWRLNEQVKMDPKLFDILWEVYRESGSQQPIDVLSAYRSPNTNAMLRRRSRLVAKYSQHMQGKAVDAHFVDVGTATIRDVAKRMQAGGVGFYHTGATPWVHIYSGSVGYWPKMSRTALARLFPDGNTVFIPADGQPMPGYEQARAEIESRGGDVQTAGTSGSNVGVLSWLFGARGGGVDDEEESAASEVAATGRGGARRSGAPTQVASAAPDPLGAAKGDLPRGATYVQPAEPAVQGSPAAASGDASAADEGGPISLRGPIAEQFIAPLPPHKPADLAAAQLAEAAAPTPPKRPAEFAFGALPGQAASEEGAASPDLIAALLERGRLPGVITRGVGAAPADALALAETPAAELSERPAMLARAAALAAPIPPIRPTRTPARVAVKAASLDGSSMQPRQVSMPSADAAANADAPAVPATRGLALLSASDSATKPNPYGDLVYDAFKVAPETPVASGLADLRGTSQ